MTFILNDESINAHGTRVLTAGIDVSPFKRNPIMSWGDQTVLYDGRTAS